MAQEMEIVSDVRLVDTELCTKFGNEGPSLSSPDDSDFSVSTQAHVDTRVCSDQP